MNSSASNAEQAVSFDFLVKVTGDKLELQHDLLQSLLVPYTDSEVPVAIITVIGQPKSRKTLLTNSIQNCIRLVGTESKKSNTAVTTSGFPRSLENCPNKSVRDKLDGQEGVLISTKPCLVQQEDGSSLVVFILDIWTENPTPSLYTRLTDFCITSSSMIILVEDCCSTKETNGNQWDISKSCLAHSEGKEFQNLHVLIHANWEEEHFYELGLEGGKRFMNARKDEFSERLSRVIDSGHILRRYFKDPSYFLAALKSESTVQKDKKHRSDSDHIRGLLDFSWKVVGFVPSKLFPLARNKTVLSTLSLNSHFHNGILKCNSIAAVTEATDATTFQQNNIEEAMELCENANSGAEVQTPSQLESKKSKCTQTNFEAREAASGNESFLFEETCVKDNMEATSSFEESTNSSSLSELDMSDANKQNADSSEIRDGFIILNKPTETIPVSHSSVLGDNVDASGEEAMDQTAAPVKPLKTSKVPLLELKQGGHLVTAYRLKLRTFIDNSSEAELFFKDDYLDSLHLQFKNQIWEDFSSQFRSSQDEEFLDTMNNELDKIFTDFKQGNSESRRLYYVHLQEVTNNSKLKFDDIVGKLRIQVLKNPLEIFYDLRNDDLDGYYEAFTGYEDLPVKWKNYFTSWYSCKSDGFKADFDFMKAVIKFYQEKMQLVLISSRSKGKKEFKEAHVLYSEQAEEIARSYEWNHEPLHDIAKEAIPLIKKTFADCVDLTNGTLGVYKTGLKAFIDNQSNSDTLYFDDDQLKAVHSKLKVEIEQPELISRIPPSVVDILLKKIKTDCDEIFSDFRTKYSEQRTSFYNFHQQVKFNTTRKFDEEVAMLELQIKKDSSNLSYDLKKASLNNYVNVFTQNVPNSKWKKYFISWYSHELDDFRKDVHAMFSAIRFYRDKLKTFLIENVCVDGNRFHEVHNSFASLVEEENKHSWKNIRLKVLSGIGIELTRQSFNKLNLDIINKEEEMAKQASIFAEEHYNSLMKSKISERTFTDSEVKTLHQMNVKAVVNSFHGVPQFKYSYVWNQYSNELGNQLHIHLSSYLKENQQNVDRVQRTKKNLLSDCTKSYHDNMNKLVAGRVLPDVMLRSCHSRSAKEALQILNITMNSSTEKFDKNSWVKELEEKLRVHFNAFTLENNSLLNEARNHQPAAAASFDHQSVTSDQSCGVGMYFGPDIVRLGTYTNPQTNPKYLKFFPFVTFERNGITFFDRDRSHHDHFDVYKTLVEEKNFPRTVFVSGKSYQLHTEEIVAVFLNKIKSEAETKFGFVITSCTVVVSAFMSTSSKQMLKTALMLAGFEQSTIIHSTTAVGLSYVVTNKVCGNVPAAFVHQAGSVFDIAIAAVNQTSISIRRISGLPYLEKSSNWSLSKLLGTTDIQDALSKKVKKLVSSTVASSEFSARELEALVMVQGENNFISDRSAITEPLGGRGRRLTTLDEAEGIVFGAAALNAFQNKIPGAPNLEYNEVYPYTVMADIIGEQMMTIVKHNVTMPVTTKNRSTHLAFNDVWSSRKVKIIEFAVEKEYVFVGEYTVNAVHSSRNFFVIVNFNSEGLIEVEAKTAFNSRTVPVQSKTPGLTVAQQCAAMENLRPILIRTVAPCYPNVPVKSEEVKTNAAAVENEMTSPVVVEPIAQDAKTKLVDLIKDVRDRLATSTATNPMILTRINDRIIECEGLLEKDGVKEKQIEMQIKLLDLAAAKIK